MAGVRCDGWMGRMTGGGSELIAKSSAAVLCLGDDPALGPECDTCFNVLAVRSRRAGGVGDEAEGGRGAKCRDEADAQRMGWVELIAMRR